MKKAITIWITFAITFSMLPYFAQAHEINLTNLTIIDVINHTELNLTDLNATLIFLNSSSARQDTDIAKVNSTLVDMINSTDSRISSQIQGLQAQIDAWNATTFDDSNLSAAIKNNFSNLVTQFDAINQNNRERLELLSSQIQNETALRNQADLELASFLRSEIGSATTWSAIIPLLVSGGLFGFTIYKGGLARRPKRDEDEALDKKPSKVRQFYDVDQDKTEKLLALRSRVLQKKLHPDDKLKILEMIQNGQIQKEDEVDAWAKSKTEEREIVKKVKK